MALVEKHATLSVNEEIRDLVEAIKCKTALEEVYWKRAQLEWHQSQVVIQRSVIAEATEAIAVIDRQHDTAVVDRERTITQIACHERRLLMLRNAQAVNAYVRLMAQLDKTV